MQRSKKDPLGLHQVHPGPKFRTLIIGAGQAGNKVYHETLDYPDNQYHIVGFVDDDPMKRKGLIGNIPILGTSADLNALIKKYKIDTVILAMPSINSQKHRELIIEIRDTRVDIVTIPSIYELLGGKIDLSMLRKVEIEDLLPRQSIQTDLSCVRQYIEGKTILLTGAGGSIGSELARQIYSFKPKHLVLFEMCENNLFYIDQELQNKKQSSKITSLIADMRNQPRVQYIFAQTKPDVVFHAAAYKHVPLMEANPTEAYENNVQGSQNLLEAAINNGVQRFINISSDKAVNPTCIMGKTKQEVEQLVTHYNGHNALISASVRFGNVLGSEGSVLKVFQRQIEQENLIRITDLKMKRYFMLIPEAVQLVLQAASLAIGGDIFFLRMGEQVPIIELARAYTRLKGFELEKDIRLEIIGNRGNEKLEEELWDPEHESIAITKNELIYRISKIRSE